MKNKSNKKVVFLIIFIAIVIFGARVYPPISDYFVLKNANSEMVQLSQNAGMTKKAELVFLRANPSLVNTSELAADCQSKNDNGQFVEQGCWVPSNQSTDGKEHIYVRKFDDSRLQPLETVVAAHETLHAIYAQLSPTALNSVDGQLESTFLSLNSTSLNNRMQEYAKIEPRSKYNELHSIIGTEQATISQSLENYYAQYFTNRQLVVAANTRVENSFTNISSSFGSEASTIAHDENIATDLYNKSVNAANNGDAYNDNYYYNQYSQEIDTVNNEIAVYNALVNQYDNLVAEYNGQPVNTITPIQTQTH